MTLEVIVADDEAPALDELVAVLRHDSRIGAIYEAASGAEVLRRLACVSVDAVFLDIHMPGLDGFDLARTLDRFVDRPDVVFVTADDAGALEAFEVSALDYVLKPIRPARLRNAVDRIVAARSRSQLDDRAEIVSVPVGRVLRRVNRDEIRWVKAEGDYSRLWSESGDDYLVRTPISELEERWGGAGFVRIHRSYLVDERAVVEARLSGPSPIVSLGIIDLPVSRRLLPNVRSRLTRRERS